MSRDCPDWQDICALSELIPGEGVCALVQDQQLALFLLRSGQLFALDNHDPLGKANSIFRARVDEESRTLALEAAGQPRRYCLHSGRNLEQREISLATFPVRVRNNRVQLALE
ncbi:nitrite reductase (NAD(P)H) small subunit [Ferrimonas futtsuensis]|uniref:nitrite reductase (NAD(P)H) small subunit n=1 Tax=Ferrimonas futtsuensis TaxID=364764 RepID=UPI000408FEB3|nr:nitrite reductase (NAD(P)H) small subunit [Ferrimonas futtsuensis]